MVVVELTIAIGEKQQSIGPGDSAPDVLDRIESGLVGPVRVLDDEDGRANRTRQQVEHRLQDTRPIAVMQGRRYRHLIAGQIPEWAKRLRNQQVVTRPKENVCSVCLTINELVNQRAFADTGFAAKQHDLASGRVEAGEQTPQQVELFIPLE